MGGMDGARVLVVDDGKLAAAGLDPPPIDTALGFGYRHQPPAER